MESLPTGEAVKEQPSLNTELYLLHYYANEERFSYHDLCCKLTYWLCVSKEASTNNRARLDIKTVTDNLQFEIAMRAGTLI